MKIIIFICLILFSNYQALEKDDLIVLLGPSAAGKSCFINTITNSKHAKVGDDSGESTTKIEEIFRSKIDGFNNNIKINLMDTMGLEDTNESALNDPMILTGIIFKIQEMLKKTQKNLKAILIFESLSNDTNKLENTIKKVKAIFGNSITSNIIVVLNKNPKPSPRRLEKLIKVIKTHNLMHIHWKSDCNDKHEVEDIYYQQMTHLQELLDMTNPYDQEFINNLINKRVDDGHSIFKKMNQATFSKYSKYFGIASAAMTAMNILNVPAAILMNVALWSFNEIYSQLKDNQPFLFFLAADDLVTKAFKKSDNLNKSDL
jgi:GTPase SAR1 family protein